MTPFWIEGMAGKMRCIYQKNQRNNSLEREQRNTKDGVGTEGTEVLNVQQWRIERGKF